MRPTLILSLLVLCCALLFANGVPLVERKVKAATPKLSSSKAKSAKPVLSPKIKPAAVKVATKPAKSPVKAASKAAPKAKIASKVKVSTASKSKVAAKAKSTPKTKATTKNNVAPKAKVGSKTTAVTKATSTKAKTIPKVKPTPKASSTTGKAKVTPAAKAPATKACPIKKASAKGKVIKGRVNSGAGCDLEQEDRETCKAITDCEKCVGKPLSSVANAKCIFTRDGLCTSDQSGLADGAAIKNSKECAKLVSQLETEQQAEFAQSDAGFIAQAAQNLYTKKGGIEDHLLGKLPTDISNPTSGRHFLSLFVKGKKTTEKTRNDQTGIVEFSAPTLKSVWNDVKDEKFPNTVVFTQKDVQQICQDALVHAITANTGTQATITAIRNASQDNGQSSSKKGKKAAKGKPPSVDDLTPLSGLNNGFVTLVKKTGLKMCVVASAKSCFPKSLKPVAGEEGDLCGGDIDVADN